MKDQPDINQGALRPATKIDAAQQPVPDIDNPPRAIADSPAFDQATAAEETERKNETLQPGAPAEREDIERKRQSGAI